MRNKITQIIAAGLLLVSFWGNGQSMKKYSKRMLAARSVEERQKLHDDFMPKYYEQMRKKYPENKQYWNSVDHIDYFFEKSEYLIEGKILDHPSAYKVVRDTNSSSGRSYRSIIITKVIKGNDLKVGNVIQIEKEYVRVFGAGRDYNYVNHNVTLLLFLNKSKNELYQRQYSDIENLSYSFENLMIFEKGTTNEIKKHELIFEDAYKHLYKKYNIQIKDSFDISNPIKYNEILKKVNAKLGTNHPLKETQKEEPIEIKKVEPIIIENIKPTYSPKELEFIKEHDRLFKEYQQYQLDSAKTPGLKWKPNRTKILNGRKVKGDTGTSTKPTPKKNINLRTEATASATVAVANMNFEIKNSKISASTTVGVNIFEFDVTGTTDVNGVFHSQTLHHIKYNPAVFGTNVMANGKMKVSNGPLFTVLGNNYTTSGIDASTTSLGVSQQGQFVSITGIGTTTSAVFNFVQLPANQSVVLYHIALQYNASICGKNTNIDFTNTFFTSLIISSTYSPNQIGLGNLETYTSVVHTSPAALIIPYCVPSISGITYSSLALNNSGVRAGSDDYIIVTGNGFGNSICGITFKNANDGGATEFTSIEDIISWTDTEIRAKVPSLLLQPLGTTSGFSVGGSGTIKIKNALGNQTTSTQSINVPIAFNNFNVNGVKYRQYLAKQNCTNGIEFTLSSSIPQAMRADVERVTKKALLDWSTTLGLNFRLQESGGIPVYSNLTSSNSTDGINLISYQAINNNDMQTKPRPKTLFTNNGLQAYNFDTDIEINSAVANWNFDLNALIYFGKSDFYFTMLHELGHAIGLDHVININKEVMHWKDMSFGVPSERATLSTTTNPVSGGLDIKTASQNIVWFPLLGFNVGTLNSTTTTPAATITSSATTTCGENVTILVTPNFATKIWLRNGTDLGITSNSRSLDVTSTGFYSFVGGRDGCTTTSNVITISPGSLPTATITTTKTQICNNYDFASVTTPIAYTSYQWRKDGVNLSGQTYNGMTVYNSGNYDLRAELNGCTTTSNVVTVTKINLPVVIPTVNYSSNPYCIGTISVTSPTTNTYQWFFPVNPIYSVMSGAAHQGQTSPNYIVALASVSLTWRVAATNCAGTTNTYIPVNANTAYLPSATAIVNYTTLGSCQAQIQLTSNNSISYQWFAPNSNTAISGATSTSFAAPLSNVAGNYTARLTNACGTTNVPIPVATQSDKKPAVSITLSNIVPTNGAPCVSSGSLLANVTNGFSSLVFMKGGTSPIGTANANPVITSYTPISNSIVATAINACGTGISNSVRQPSLCSTGCIPSQYSSVCGTGFRSESNFETSNNNVNFQLKPNPNKGNFTVNSTIESTYFITDLLGKELATGLLQIGENQIETSLISGIYVFIFGNNRVKMVVE